jgi:hypothetical protein
MLERMDHAPLAQHVMVTFDRDGVSRDAPTQVPRDRDLALHTHADRALSLTWSFYEATAARSSYS